jgi:DNA primase
MKYPKEYLDEIKTRLKVSSVVSKTVSLKKRGKEFVGLSPFKNEKTPSFTVNDEKNFIIVLQHQSMEIFLIL